MYAFWRVVSCHLGENCRCCLVPGTLVANIVSRQRRYHQYHPACATTPSLLHFERPSTNRSTILPCQLTTRQFSQSTIQAVHSHFRAGLSSSSKAASKDLQPDSRILQEAAKALSQKTPDPIMTVYRKGEYPPSNPTPFQSSDNSRRRSRTSMLTPARMERQESPLLTTTSPDASSGKVEEVN
jgi:hypothetical protein